MKKIKKKGIKIENRLKNILLESKENENIKKFIEKDNFITECQKKDFFYYQKKRYTFYKNPESNIQIYTIIKNSLDDNNLDYYKIAYLFYKFIDSKNVFKLVKILENLINKVIDNQIFYDTDFFRDILKLKSNEKKEFNKEKCDKNQYLLQYLSKIILDEINKEKIKLINILDFGCGECKKIKSFGNLLNLKEIYACDIKSWGPYEKNRQINKSINFSFFEKDKKLPYEDNFFSILYCSFVLHHVENIDFILQEFARIVKPGGFLIILEHDCWTDYDNMLIDLEHTFFEYKKSEDKYNYAKYYNYLEWDYILLKYNFEYIKAEYISYDINYKIKSDRSFYGIYKKNLIID
jgi:ubiquinone/menaquinone biosynthesis C-methylase UbiE